MLAHPSLCNMTQEMHYEWFVYSTDIFTVEDIHPGHSNTSLDSFLEEHDRLLQAALDEENQHLQDVGIFIIIFL